MSSTSQLTTFSDLFYCKQCARCKEMLTPGSFGTHAWCRRCCSEYNKSRPRPYRSTPAETRRRNLKKKFGITPEQYDDLLTKQGGKCAICGTTSNFTFKNLCVDHDHKTGLVRGLLCLNCNTALGQLKDSTDLLLKAVDYLEGFK